MDRNTQDPGTPKRKSDGSSQGSLTAQRIHILGLGSIGLLVAHALRSAPNPPPVTLMFHRPETLKSWYQAGEKIVVRRGQHTSSSEGFDAELTAPSLLAKEDATDVREPIDCLIVCTKAAHTVSAIQPLSGRISSSTTVCFLQNGMGTIETVNKELFPEEASRPLYIQGIITHGANIPAEAPGSYSFLVVHAGDGTISLGTASQGPDLFDSPVHEAQSQRMSNGRHIINALRQAPNLGAVYYPSTQLLQLLLEKLSVNCVINPLTALFNVPNGKIGQHDSFLKFMRSILEEVSLVFRSLPELSHIPDRQDRFSLQRLEERSKAVVQVTSENISSMLADTRSGRTTEIDYINGYIVRKGKEIGIDCKVNEMLVDMVVAKSYA